MDSHKRNAALHAITVFSERSRGIGASGLAIMMDAWADTERAIDNGTPAKKAVEDNFTEPLAGRILRAIG